MIKSLFERKLASVKCTKIWTCTALRMLHDFPMCLPATAARFIQPIWNDRDSAWLRACLCTLFLAFAYTPPLSPQHSIFNLSPRFHPRSKNWEAVEKTGAGIRWSVSLSIHGSGVVRGRTLGEQRPPLHPLGRPFQGSCRPGKISISLQITSQIRSNVKIEFLKIIR